VGVAHASLLKCLSLEKLILKILQSSRPVILRMQPELQNDIVPLSLDLEFICIGKWIIVKSVLYKLLRNLKVFIGSVHFGDVSDELVNEASHNFSVFAPEIRRHLIFK